MASIAGILNVIVVVGVIAVIVGCCLPWATQFDLSGLSIQFPGIPSGALVTFEPQVYYGISLAVGLLAFFAGLFAGVFQYRLNKGDDKAPYVVLGGGIVSFLCVAAWQLSPGSFVQMPLNLLPAAPVITLIGGLVLIVGGASELSLFSELADV